MCDSSTEVGKTKRKRKKNNNERGRVAKVSEYIRELSYAVVDDGVCGDRHRLLALSW